jgi:Na+/H+-dicarboxylate symporter
MGSTDDLLLLLVFLAWSAMIAVSAHRRVRNMVLASAGAAGVASGSFVALLGLTTPAENRQIEQLALFFVLGLFASLVIAVLTWIVMKLGGWLPRPDDADTRGH